MYSNFSEFVDCVKEAKFSFESIWQAIVSLFKDASKTPDVSSVWNDIVEFVSSYNHVSMLIVAILSLTLAFFGRKMMGLVRFVAFFVAGFMLGAHLLTPLLPPDVEIPAWIIGIVVALIAGVLSKFLYTVLYVVAAGYSMYIVAYNGFYLGLEASYADMLVTVALISAFVAIIIALLLKKYIEMIGTAALGSWLAVIVVSKNLYDFTAWKIFEGNEKLAIIIPTAIIALIGAAIQIKTRRRY